MHNDCLGTWEIVPVTSLGRNHLSIRGVCAQNDGEVSLYFNDLHLSTVQLSAFRFKFYICNGFRALKVGSRLSVVVNGVKLKHRDGSYDFIVTEEDSLCCPSGALLDVENFLLRGMVLTKKGTFSDPNCAENKSKWLQIYSDFCRWYEERYDSEFVCVTHGTLLGAVRSGDFIPGDDDFDCFYFDHNAKDARQVSQNRLVLMRQLKQSKWRARIGATGHVKVHRDGVHIDVMPAWIEGNHLNIGGYTSMPLLQEQIDHLATKVVSLRGQAVRAIVFAECFLAHQYGDNWRVPDPTWRYHLTSKVKENLKMLRPSILEVEEFGGSTIKRKYGLI